MIINALQSDVLLSPIWAYLSKIVLLRNQLYKTKQAPIFQLAFVILQSPQAQG